jgi:phosphomannomutase
MHSFRECDIRGKYPIEVHEALFKAIGKAIGARWHDGPVVVGRDFRNGSLSLSSALIEGLLYSGARVIDAGCVPTPILYFARRQCHAAVAAMVTASHNPPEYNGLKLLLRDRPASRKEIDWLQKNIFVPQAQQTGGKYEAKDVISPYIAEIERFWGKWVSPVSSAPKPRFVADPGGGSWSLVSRRLFRQLNLPCVLLHDDPDGSFSARSPDCSASSSLNRLAARVVEERAELGVAWDGDGDRFAAIDGRGTILTADQLGLLFARSMPITGEKVLLDVKISRKVDVALRSLGAIPVIEKSAHCALETAMLEQDCIFGCEYSGHYFFRDLHGADDGMFAALRLIGILVAQKGLENALKELPDFHLTPDVRIPADADDFRELRDCLANSPFFELARLSSIDGVKFMLPHGWVLFRRSVSEDKISFRAEGDTPSDLAIIVRNVIAALPERLHALRGELAARVYEH